MRTAANAIAAILLLATPAANADLGLYCPKGPPKRCQYSCCSDNGHAGAPGGAIGAPISSPAGPTSTGDPLILADQTTFQRVLDYATDTPNGRLAFFRSYSSSYSTFAYGTGVENGGVPKPFGSNPTGCQSSPSYLNCSLRWWHNYFVYATTIDIDTFWGWGPQPWAWMVRDQDGFPVNFKQVCGTSLAQPCGCTGCACGGATCSPTSVGTAELSRLVNVTPDLPSPTLMLQQRDGTRLYFDGNLGKFVSTYGHTFHFLTSIANAAGKTIAAIDYEFPSSCAGAEAGAAGTSSGVPYIKYVRAVAQGQIPGIGSLKFYYRMLPNPGSGNECVIDHVTAINAVAADGTLTESPVASYTYRQTSGAESAGLLATATKPGGQETYAYVEPSGASGFHMTGAGQEWVHQTYSGSAAVSVASPWSTQSVSATSVADSDPYCSRSVQVRTILDAQTGRGDFSGSQAPLTTRRTLLPDDGLHDWRPVDSRDACDPAAPYSCSPGTEHHEYNCNDGRPQVERGIQNKRGYWEVFDRTSPSDGNPAHIELSARKKGALSLTDPSPLEIERYGYSYLRNDPTNSLADMQLRASVKHASLLAAGAPDSETRTIYQTDASGNINSDRIKAVLRHGWTNTLDSAGAPQLSERYIGTFYFTNRKCSGDATADPQDRTLEVHGPCLVDPQIGFNATDCTDSLNTTFSIVQHYYGRDPEMRPRLV